MSRIGKKPITVPSGVKVDLAGSHCKVTGSKGTLEMDLNAAVNVKIENNEIIVENANTNVRWNNQMHGTVRSLLQNMVTGVTSGFEKKMMIYGTGYSIKEQGGKLVLSIGFCHPVEMPIPKGLALAIEVPATRGNDVPAKFSLSGIDKCLLGQFAAEIRKVRPPEPYQGKGIRYADEVIVKKEGKAFASGG